VYQPKNARAHEFIFDKTPISIGAMEDNDLVIEDDTVSRYHCRLLQERETYILQDLESTNGTYINRVKIREAWLTPGCTIHLGDTSLSFTPVDETLEIKPSNRERFGGIIGQNIKLREIYGILEKVAPTTATIVIEGETGTGKEVVAHAIHQASSRADKPFMVFDCSAVPDNLIESELFGHEKGAFTNAINTRQGVFELANTGTIFLDELGELNLDLQPKLLRALEQREVKRVGASKPAKVDVRVIAATNRDLEEEVKAGRFRQDLFYRLSVVRIRLPALRERKDDIKLLVSHFLNNLSFNRKADGQPKVRGITAEALEMLIAYNWPGNVRELLNICERAVSFAEGLEITAEDLPDYIRTPLPSSGGPRKIVAPSAVTPKEEPPVPVAPVQVVTESVPAGHLEMPFKDAKEKWVASFEREYIVHLLKKNNNNISHASREADIDRKYFRKLMKKYEIASSEPDEEE
jgi:DNA-binding NtrC family response regulator